MDAKVPELLDLTKKLLDQSVEIVNDSLPSSESVPAKEVRYSIFLRVQMSEALKFGYGAYHSCNCGWGHGGIGAARSIYEVLLDIKYINHNETRRDECFTRFLDHGAEYLYRKMERILQAGQEVSQDVQDERKDAYDQLKEKYDAKYDQEVKAGVAKPSPRYSPLNWTGRSITQKADEVNLEQFHQLYKDLANLSHVSIAATLDAIEDSTEEQFEADLNLEQSFTHCFSVLTVVFTCIFGMLEEYMRYFKIDYSCYPALGCLLEGYKELLNR